MFWEAVFQGGGLPGGGLPGRRCSEEAVFQGGGRPDPTETRLEDESSPMPMLTETRPEEKSSQTLQLILRRSSRIRKPVERLNL